MSGGLIALHVPGSAGGEPPAELGVRPVATGEAAPAAADAGCFSSSDIPSRC